MSLLTQINMSLFTPNKHVPVYSKPTYHCLPQTNMYLFTSNQHILVYPQSTCPCLPEPTCPCSPPINMSCLPQTNKSMFDKTNMSLITPNQHVLVFPQPAYPRLSPTTTFDTFCGIYRHNNYHNLEIIWCKTKMRNEMNATSGKLIYSLRVHPVAVTGSPNLLCCVLWYFSDFAFCCCVI